MKEINKEDIKVGDFLYLVDKNKGQERAFIVKIMEFGDYIDIGWWSMERKPNFSFEIDFLLEENEINGECKMDENDWESYNLSKLNKKDEEDFKRHIILKNL